MNKLKQHILNYFERLVSLFPLKFLNKILKINLILPYYHLISDEEVIHVKHLYKFRNTKQFKDDLDFFLKNYSPICINDLLENIKKNLLPQNSFLLSFDDGFREIYDIVTPILLEKGVSAIFFINPDYIDNKNMFFRCKTSIIIENIEKNKNDIFEQKIKEIFFKNKINYIDNKDLKTNLLFINYNQRHILDEIALILNIDFKDYLLKYKPYLTSEQIKSLLKQGFSIGSHSIDHPNFSQISLDEQIYQVKKSMEILKNDFLITYNIFAFPFSDDNISKEFFKEIYDNKIIDISFGTSDMREDIFEKNFQRFWMEGKSELYSVSDVINKFYTRKLLRKLRNKDKIHR